MTPIEKNVLADSDIFFYKASELALELFFYPLCIGHYHCAPGYRVIRNSYNSFLVIYVADGSGYLCVDGDTIALRTGEFAILDCYHPHEYGTETGWQIFWMHFDGQMARRYYELCNRGGPVQTPENILLCRRQIEKILMMFRSCTTIREPEMSRRITQLLCEFIQIPNANKKSDHASQIIDESLAFMTEHMDQPLTLEVIARHVALSPYYFSHLFKQETGYSPHDYLIRARVDKAKYLLKTADMSLKKIAFCCGFSNECNFSSTFKRITGVTPLAYKKGSSKLV